MIVEFLEGYYKELLEDKISYKQNLNNLQNKFKENAAFLDLLKEKTDPYLESFTPREVNRTAKHQIADLENEQKILEDQISTMESSYEKLSEKILYLNRMLKKANELEKRDATSIVSDMFVRAGLFSNQLSHLCTDELDILNGQVDSILDLLENGNLLEAREELIATKNYISEVERNVEACLAEFMPIILENRDFYYNLDYNLNLLFDSDELQFHYSMDENIMDLSELSTYLLFGFLFELLFQANHIFVPKEMNIEFLLEDQHICFAITFYSEYSVMDSFGKNIEKILAVFDGHMSVKKEDDLVQVHVDFKEV